MGCDRSWVIFLMLHFERSSFQLILSPSNLIFVTNEYFTNSGVPYDILKSEFYVPSSCARKESERYRGKKQFGEILDVKEATTLAYFKRLIEERIYLKKILFHSWLLSPLLLLVFWIHTRARTSNEKRVGKPLRN